MTPPAPSDGRGRAKMNGEPEVPSPGSVPAPEPAPPPKAAPSKKRRLVASLIALYALSIVAAAFLLWRGQPKEEDGGERFGTAAVLLGKKKDAVGIVTIQGPIYRSSSGRVFERGVEQWTRKLRRMAKRKDVKALVLQINSPGGSVGAVQELYSMIRRVRNEYDKPIVAHLGDVAASGGYYIAAACDKIVSHPGSLLG